MGSRMSGYSVLVVHTHEQFSIASVWYVNMWTQDNKLTQGLRCLGTLNVTPTKFYQ